MRHFLRLYLVTQYFIHFVRMLRYMDQKFLLIAIVYVNLLKLLFVSDILNLIEQYMKAYMEFK